MMLKKRWVKSVVLLLLLLGLLISVSANYAELFYIMAFLAGIIIGRIVYLEQPKESKKAKKPLFPLISLIIILIIIFASSFSRIWALLLLFLGGLISYYLHRKKLVGSFKSESFIK